MKTKEGINNNFENSETQLTASRLWVLFNMEQCQPIEGGGEGGK